MPITPNIIKIIFLSFFNVAIIILVILTIIILNYHPAEEIESPNVDKARESKMVESMEKTRGIIIRKNKKENPYALKEKIKAEKFSVYNPNSYSFKSKSSLKFKSLGWIPFWDQANAFASFQKNVGVFTHISLFWYSLKADGSVKKYTYAKEDKNIINYAHANGVKVFALVANLPDEDEGGDWDYKRVDKVIDSSFARRKHITDLVALTKRLGVDGINIDYEAMRVYQKDNFTLFIKELSVSLHKNGKILAVALHPKESEGDPEYSNGSQAQDWRALSKYADQMHLMTYDEHWITSSAGPIASVPWVKIILTYAKKQIPLEKLFAGIPLYGYDWGSDSRAKGLTYTDVKGLIKKYNPKVLIDQKTKSKHFGYRDSSGVSHTVWFEDKDTFVAKLNLFNNLGIDKLAFWRLGKEDSRVWTTLRNSK